MRLKKILSLLLAMTMLFSCVGITAMAEESATVAKIGDTPYDTLAGALTAAQDNDTVTLVWKEGDAPIAMNGAVFGKTVTIIGTATVDWSKGNLFIGRGGEGNGVVIFNNANLTSASDNASTGIHVSGREKGTDNKYDGTVIIKDSVIELDYLINKGTMTLDNSTLTVKNGFSIGGRPANETESGEDATATMNLNNGSKVVVNNHNGMGLGYEAIGVMNVTGSSTFECTQDFLITAKGTMNVDGGNVIIAGKLTNLGVDTTFKDATVKINKLDNDAALFIEGTNTIQIEDASGSSYAVRVKDGAVFNNSYMPGTANETVRLLGSATFNGGFKCAFLEGSSTGVGGTVTIEDSTVIDTSYGVNFSKNYTLNGGTIKLSGGNADGTIWGCVFQSGEFVINSDIVLEGHGGTAPIHFTNATATVNGSISQSKTGGEPIYVAESSTVTFGDDAVVTTDCSVHVIGTLKSSGDVNGTITKVKDSTVIEISGGTYTQDVSTWCTDSCEITKNEDGTFGVTVKVSEPTGTLGTMYVQAAKTDKNTSDRNRVYGEITGMANINESIVVELYSGETLLATTTLAKPEYLSEKTLGINIVISGSISNSWSTVWEEGMPRTDLVPTSAVLYLDGTEMNKASVTLNAIDNLGEPTVWETLPGVNAVGLSGSGTEKDPYLINNLAELKWFRDDVNSGNDYSGKFVKLTANIDLNDEEWTPIAYNGKTFKGNFDGGNKTVKNLKITKELVNASVNNCIGFFGRTDSPAVICNLTIENVSITGSLYVGAVVGLGYTGNKIENCTVKGDIAIDAWWYAGVIGGNGYMNLVDNCHVIGSDNSYIKGNDGSYIGGIWGFRGENAQKTTNCTVTNLSITGVDRVGGISGIAHYGNIISDCFAKDVTITATDPDATTVGLIAGACQGTKSEPSVFEGNTVENVTAKAGDSVVTGFYGTNIDGSVPVTNYIAKVNGVAYETLQAAVEAAQEKGTIVLLDNVTEDVTINKSITLDGAYFGYTGQMNVSGNISVTVQNVNFVKGSIKHDGASSKGTLTVKNCTFADGGYAVTTNSIKNVTIEDCTVTNQSLLYANKSTVNVLIKDVTVSGGNYGFHWVYGTTATLENVTMSNMKYGVYVQNYADKTVTIKNCEISGTNPIAIWERANKSGVQTFKFEGTNNLGTTEFTISDYAILKLAEADATLKAPEGLNVTTDLEGYVVEYADGKYSLKEIEKVELFSLSNVNVTLGNSFSMNFYYDKSNFDGNNYYAEIKHAAVDGEKSAIIPYDEWIVNGNLIYVPYSGITAKQMADKLTITIFKTDGTKVSNTQTDSMADCSKRFLDYYSTTDNMKLWNTAFVDMLNYGAAAQRLFEYNKDDLANAVLTTDYQNNFATKEISLKSDIEYSGNLAGTLLTLSDRILFSAVFNGITEDMTVTIEYTDHYGKEHSSAGTFKRNGTSDYYEVIVDSLVIADAAQPVKVTVYNKDGSVYAWVKESVNSYLSRVAEMEPKKRELYEMIAKFAASTHAALHAND